MKTWRSIVLAAAFLAGAAIVPPAGGAAQKTGPQMWGRISEGVWELRRRDGSVQRICIGDRTRLIQLRHPEGPCSQIVLEDNASSLTVQYTCRGRGYGRTHIRLETGQLIQLDSQGIADGLPFEFSAEGRRIGDCTP